MKKKKEEEENRRRRRRRRRWMEVEKKPLSAILFPRFW